MKKNSINLRMLSSNISEYLNFLQIAADMFREHVKNLIQENISSALSILKSNPGSTYEPTFLQNLMKDFII
jgi:hypothetical protein